MIAPIILFSGTSNPTLASAIASIRKIPLGSLEITRFIDNECRVYMTEDVKGKNVFVLQSLSAVADQHLVELCLIGQAAKSLGAGRMTAVIPWMGYSKQDKAFRKGEAVSASLVAKFIEVAGFDAVMTVELHSENVVPFFHIPVTELSAHELLGDALKRLNPASAGFNLKQTTTVVSPDAGGKSRSARFAKTMGLPIVYLEKDRDKVTGKVMVTGVSGDVGGKDVVIFDDIINTGATAIKTSQFLKGHGAKRIFFLATHAVLAGDASQKLGASPIDHVVVTDTITIPKEKRFDKLSIVSVAPLLANAL